jgi:uncharacterized SAM-binding protein YcdF (DUF218 family)
MHRHRRKILKALLGLFVGLLLAGLTAWLFPQQLLTVDSGPVQAQVMVVLGGGVTERPLRAAELFKADAAPLIICSGYGDATSYQKILSQSGVPAEDVWLEPKSRTTRENAQFTIALLRQHQLTNAIIVTSWYHSRRALACFEHYAPDIRFYSRPSYFGYPPGAKAETLKPEMAKGEQAAGAGPGADVSISASQLSAFRAAQAARQKAEWKQVRVYADSEYVKLLGYWIIYGVDPF